MKRNIKEGIKRKMEKGTDAASVQIALERRILEGLSCEWELGLWVLDSGVRRLMKKPIFRLADTTRRVGQWSKEWGEICISREFALHHPWESVRQVMLHEMAHQLADVLGRDADETPHGPTFRRACDMLRADPAAAGRFPGLEQSVSPKDPADQILSRVQKLLSLARSSNRHEAEAAMLKAHDLIAKHNLDMLNRTERRDFITTRIGRPGLRHRQDESLLANLLINHYFVQGIWVPIFVLEKGKRGRVMEISGTQQNVEMAAYVHDFVSRFIDAEWERYNRDKGLTLHRKTDFAIGIINGFMDKLDQQLEAKDPIEYSPVLVGDPQLKAYMKYRYRRIRSTGGSRRRHDPDVYKDGKRIGKSMVIHKGIEEKEGNKGRLIPG